MSVTGDRRASLASLSGQILRALRPLILLSLAATLMACGEAAEMGEIKVTRASVDTAGAGSRLRASIRYDFSESVLDALHHGVPLTVEWDLELRHHRDWFWDGTRRRIQQAATLSFHSLSERYVVTYDLTEQAQVFPSLMSALQALGTVDEPVFLDLQPDADQKLYLRLRSRLDLASLPPPLQLPALMSSDWRTRSTWYQWPLSPT